ncbi:hexosaminidase [Microbacterium terrae]|uniref:beta-N-acetylhexosaminidase n=1 Tax=Microbacterium terrae TaxID=69369 RepID=A0A0M2H268_9MICO|nr:family 20 glycosylhydrolase [Microbacterium terrae]KJL37544.1 Beta-N-acetylhexosaminidase [Microbacterium terrae]MBP1076374.1 hexosaminidase [Microbacterium terrae]GLJ97198.1 beta-N-acetylhexosaminidase [Microbacterium terrae]
MPSLPVIPSPAVVVLGEGALRISDLTTITVSDERALTLATRFREDLARWGGPMLGDVSVTRERVGASVRFVLTSTDTDPRWPGTPGVDDAHTVVVDEQGVVVESAHLSGLVRGAASVIQLLARSEGDLGLVRFEDRARWSWRGLSVDVVRWFVPYEQLKRIVDLLALYKFNVLHLHLSDNEGWRLEIPGWPMLTTGEGDTREYLTLDEYDDLVAYAADRFITVVPEIDMPGHVAAALRAYPELNPIDAAGLEGPFPIANLSPDSDAAWRFLDDVLRTLAAHTPGPFIHVGGDEAFGMDADAHAAFVNRAIATVKQLGKQSIGWQETSRADVGPDHIAQYWVDFKVEGDKAPESGSKSLDDVSESSMAALAAHFAEAMLDGERINSKGSRLLVSPLSRAYLDRPHGERSWSDAQEALRARLGLQYYPGTAVRDYLEWNPAEILPAIDESRIVGVETAIWCESVKDLADLEALLLPRLPAIAEVGWSAKPTSWDEYRERLAQHAPLWTAQDWRWFEVETVDWIRR